MGKIKISYIEEKDLELIYRLYKHFAVYERLEDYHTASADEIKKMVFDSRSEWIQDPNYTDVLGEKNSRQKEL